MHSAIRRTLQALQSLQSPAGAVAERLKRLRHAGFKVDSVGTEDGATLAEAFTQVVDLLALKAARDAIIRGRVRRGTSSSWAPARTARWSAS